MQKATFYGVSSLIDRLEEVLNRNRLIDMYISSTRVFSLFCDYYSFLRSQRLENRTFLSLYTSSTSRLDVDRKILKDNGRYSLLFFVYDCLFFSISLPFNFSSLLAPSWFIFFLYLNHCSLDAEAVFFSFFHISSILPAVTFFLSSSSGILNFSLFSVIFLL